VIDVTESFLDESTAVDSVANTEQFSGVKRAACLWITRIISLAALAACGSVTGSASVPATVYDVSAHFDSLMQVTYSPSDRTYPTSRDLVGVMHVTPEGGGSTFDVVSCSTDTCAIGATATAGTGGIAGAGVLLYFYGSNIRNSTSVTIKGSVADRVR
jgi:hypothetical protein